MNSNKKFNISTILFLLFILMSYENVYAQQYRNEWINHNQTYYKFKVGSDNVYRISKETLATIGWDGVDVSHFQLWRNGEMVPFYSTVPTGTLPAGGYLEFWGKRNDGIPDTELYLQSSYQHTNGLSIITDTATYFLTYNTNASGFKYSEESNDVSSNSLPVEPHFKYKLTNYYRNQLHQGIAEMLGEYVYSSSYDRGEFWSSASWSPSSAASTRTLNLANIRYAGTGNSPILKVGLAGSAPNNREVEISVGGTPVINTVINQFLDYKNEVAISPSLIVSDNSLSIVFLNKSTVSSDRVVASYVELEYDRLFNFNNSTQFEFELEAKSEGYYLEISGFNHGTTAPVLYDLTNGRRYVVNITTPAIKKIVLPGDTKKRKFVLVNQTANIRNVTSLTPVNFINFTDQANQGNYIIISNPLLYNGTNGVNPVAEYANYRASSVGGGYQTIYVDDEQVIDQFGYGIKKHPLAIRNFVKYAQHNFSNKPKYFFIIGRGVDYRSYRTNESKEDVNQLNLVPTFGIPGSDNLFSSASLADATPVTPIGRLSVVHPYEIEDYLQKVKEHEQQNKFAPNTIQDRAWMKNIVNVTGSSSEFLGTQLCNYMSHYGFGMKGPSLGANVHLFCKTSASGTDLLNSQKISSLFEEGINVLSYFGHSSATTLEFNIESPDKYNNTNGKYPLFLVNGCNAGNYFTYFPARMITNETLTESFVLAKQRGAIGFIASTHYGVVSFLNVYMDFMTKNISSHSDSLSIGELLQKSLRELLVQTGSNSYLGRLHVEQLNLHGDPSVKLFAQEKPDYVIEESSIKISPNHISVSQQDFDVNILLNNIGKAFNDSLQLKIEQVYPDGSVVSIFDQKIRPVYSVDSFKISIPIIATRDKGLNKIRVYLNHGNAISEVDYTNNFFEKEIFILEEGVSPSFPYQYSIVNNPQQKLYASTNNPFISTREFIFQMDTVATFNSSLKVERKETSSGGVIETNPLLTYVDGTVYYWRVAEIPPNNDTIWNTSSFLFESNSPTGFNQSHYYQHLNSFNEQIYLSDDRVWKFESKESRIDIRNGVFPTAASQSQDFLVNVNDDIVARSVCGTAGIFFVVLDSLSLRPWINGTSGSAGKFNSDAICGTGRENQFQYNYNPVLADSAKRRYAMEFLENVPDGNYVIVRNIFDNNEAKNMYYEQLKMDTIAYGSNNSLYHKLLYYGFNAIDQINSRKSYIFIFKKNRNAEFEPRWIISESEYDRIALNVAIQNPYQSGSITSPTFGPALEWSKIEWQGSSLNNETSDSVQLEIYVIDKENVKSRFQTYHLEDTEIDISGIDASIYPYIQLKLINKDTVHLTPFQLNFWRTNYKSSPEGAVSPNLKFSMKDTFYLGEKGHVQLAFKNISNENFDSISVRATIIDQNNISHILHLPKLKALQVGDTAVIDWHIDSENYIGNNTILIEVNPGFDQPELSLNNNFIYKDFHVLGDQVAPVLDVTFDGVRILNGDIVSAKPMIQMKLKDDSKFLLLNDTSLVTVHLKYPNGVLKQYYFNQMDTLRFIPATNTENNEATIEFTPHFTDQINPEGDEYELIVRARDKNGNSSSSIDFRNSFKVITKSMISNMLNYPNPFSTSTAFVFTLTGSEVPKNFKIQILTVTGKIVREITREELGPLHIGKNITEFKWDGTDQFGQKLGNGVYLYRVVTSLNGNRLEKYKASGDHTDQFFVNGYGKMYLMR